MPLTLVFLDFAQASLKPRRQLEPRSTTDRQSLSVTASTECHETKLVLSWPLAAGCREARAILHSEGTTPLSRLGIAVRIRVAFRIISSLALVSLVRCYRRAEASVSLFHPSKDRGPLCRLAINDRRYAMMGAPCGGQSKPACVFATLLRRYGWLKAFVRSLFSMLSDRATLAGVQHQAEIS